MKIIPEFECFTGPDGIAVVSVRFREAGPGPSMPRELTAHDAWDLKETLEAASAPSGCHGIVVDLEGVEYIDAAILGALVVALKGMRERGGGVAVAGACDYVRRAFEITRLCKLFVKAETVLDGRDRLTKGYRPYTAGLIETTARLHTTSRLQTLGRTE